MVVWLSSDPQIFNEAGRALLAGLDGDAPLYAKHLDSLQQLDSERALSLNAIIQELSCSSQTHRDIWLERVARDIAPFYSEAAKALARRISTSPVRTSLLADLDSLAEYFSIPLDE